MMDETIEVEVEQQEPELDGMAMLRAAFTETPEATGSGDETVSDDGETPDADRGTPEVLAELSEEDISKVLNSPRVISALRQAQQAGLQQARAVWEMEQQQRQMAEEDSLLDDEEVGRRVREQQRMTPILQQAQVAGYARAQQDLMRLGIGSIWDSVPELKEMPADKKAALDPMNPQFKNMGDYFNALVDAAAASRAEKLAESKAKKMAKAMAQDQVNKFRQGQPNTAGAAGSATRAPLIDIDKMSGREILSKAFQA